MKSFFIMIGIIGIIGVSILLTFIVLSLIDNPSEPCWNYHIIIEVSYIDGSTEEIEIEGTTPGNYYIGPDDQFPDKPKIEIISVRGQALLVHYPNCGGGPPVIAAWNVGRYRVIGMSRGGCYPTPCV